MRKVFLIILLGSALVAGCGKDDEVSFTSPTFNPPEGLYDNVTSLSQSLYSEAEATEPGFSAQWLEPVFETALSEIHRFLLICQEKIWNDEEQHWEFNFFEGEDHISGTIVPMTDYYLVEWYTNTGTPGEYQTCVEYNAQSYQGRLTNTNMPHVRMEFAASLNGDGMYILSISENNTDPVFRFAKMYYLFNGQDIRLYVASEYPSGYAGISDFMENAPGIFGNVPLSWDNWKDLGVLHYYSVSLVAGDLTISLYPPETE
ncbi:MAG TPA: hypothetical protein ENL46_06475 [Candidatus Aminicenantes bacterium]|nr:hypothetical protein [Candidatus Aminicenantes bacterium]